MADEEGGRKEVVDLDAALDAALEGRQPRGRAATKTQQLRLRIEKLVALRARGFTLDEIAEIAGVSKDTLRHALRGAPKGKKPKATALQKQQQLAQESKAPKVEPKVEKTAAARREGDPGADIIRKLGG